MKNVENLMKSALNTIYLIKKEGATCHFQFLFAACENPAAQNVLTSGHYCHLDNSKVVVVVVVYFSSGMVYNKNDGYNIGT